MLKFSRFSSFPFSMRGQKKIHVSSKDMLFISPIILDQSIFVILKSILTNFLCIVLCGVKVIFTEEPCYSTIDNLLLSSFFFNFNDVSLLLLLLNKVGTIEMIRNGLLTR